MTIYQSFNPLFKRLLEIKNSDGRADVYGFGDYDQVIFDLQNNIGDFSPSELLPVIKYHLKIIAPLMASIKTKFPQEVKEIQRPIQIDVYDHTDHQYPKIPNEIYFLEELEYYQEKLRSFLETCSQFIDISDSVSSINTRQNKISTKELTPFTYVHLNNHPEKVKELFASLVRHDLISKTSDYKQFKRIFSGNIFPTELITWTGKNQELSYFIKKLKNEKCIKDSGNSSHWKITEKCFQSQGGEHLGPQLRSTTLKNQKQILLINRIVANFKTS